jgi:hypothetical protein
MFALCVLRAYDYEGITQSMGVKADQDRVATLAQELALLAEQSRAELAALEGSSQVSYNNRIKKRLQLYGKLCREKKERPPLGMRVL